MSAPQIAAPGDTDLGSAENEDMAGLIGPPAAIPQVGPVEPLLRPAREPAADSGKDPAGEREQTSPDEELATVTELRSSPVDGVVTESAADHAATTAPEGRAEDAEVVPEGAQPSASSAGAEETRAAPAVPAPAPVPAPPPAPEPPQEPKRRRFLGAAFYPAIFWISVLVGLVGQIIGFGDQFGGQWYSYAGAVVVGGIFELTMITAGDASLRRIGRARPVYEWLPFLVISMSAAGVAAYMNFTHWVWAGATMAVYFGGLTVGGYLGHLIEGVFDALQDRRATHEYERAQRDYEQAKAEEEAEARKAWKRYQRSLDRAAEITPKSSARPRATSSSTRASAGSSKSAPVARSNSAARAKSSVTSAARTEKSALLAEIVDYAMRTGCGYRAAHSAFKDRARCPSDSTVKRELDKARQRVSAS